MRYQANARCALSDSDGISVARPVHTESDFAGSSAILIQGLSGSSRR